MTLEELLNKLIEKGWKPRGKEGQGDRGYFIPGDEMFFRTGEVYQYRSINDLCSLDSGLRQFVVDKRLYNKNTIQEMLGAVGKEFYYQEDFRYRLMLSSIQTDKEKFLLDNISLGQH